MTRRKDLSNMKFAPEPEYHSACHKGAIWVFFDLRDERVVQSLHLQRAALAEFGDLVGIDQDHVVLIMLPGGARRLI
jgi:hypothetical protein